MDQRERHSRSDENIVDLNNTQTDERAAFRVEKNGAGIGATIKR